MSNRYKGGVISATPPTTTGGESGTASGAWTLEQQMQAQAAGLWPVAPPDPSLFIENLFSTYLYTGNGSTQTITNGIDLSTKGGLVWIKSRSSGSEYHALQDTVRGRGNVLSSNTSDQSFSSSAGESITTYNSNGFSLGINRSVTQAVNTNAATYVSWAFREQAKFFDVVTYTGTGVARTVAHNLGSVPGCMIVKRTDDADGWAVYHRSLGATKYIFLDQSNASGTYSGYWNNTEPTSSVFSLGNDAAVNASGATYVAYLFAHDAGGFGLTGTDNVISCGSFTTDGSAKAVVDLGYEPQWILHKRDEAGEDWRIADNMRGWQSDGTFQRLEPNTSDAEANTPSNLGPTATGFETFGNAGASKTFIYIAIRRGPMKVPTLGTSVFSPLAATLSSDATRSISLVPDAMLYKWRTGVGNFSIEDRLRGFAKTNTNSAKVLSTNLSAAEATEYPIAAAIQNTTWIDGAALNGVPSIIYNLKRAPSFFDEVCYTGTGATQNVAHNLGVIPSFIVCKRRDGVANWCALAGKSNGTYESLYLNTTVGTLYTAPSAAVAGLTATTFNPQAVFPSEVNGSGETYVAYLFGTVAGVSKVGSYTGTGTTLQIDCGFTAGSRFVMIKRTDSTGDWYVWDSARGIVAGNDPYLLLNSTAAEVTGTDYVDTANSGFEISSTAPAAINANGGTFIFLAIA